MSLTSRPINEKIKVYLVDDEQLALNRLHQLLEAFDSVKIVGSTTAPQTAISFLQTENIDLLFLDINMPGLNGFELLAKLPSPPIIIFTTAYDQYALKAFETNSLDYLLKPVNPQHLERALTKFSRFRETAKLPESSTQFQSLISELKKLSSSRPESFDRITYRIGKRIFFLDLSNIIYFYSEDKVTFAATTEAKRYIVDFSITELEVKLKTKGFVRIHRATLVNLSFINELHYWFGGRMRIRLKDKNQTELTVARKQVKILKDRLGI